MKLYNELFGVYPAADELLAMLEMHQDVPPRFRDCFLSDTGEYIVVLTRTGGAYKPKWEERNGEMRRRTGFVLDAEETYDKTYVRFIFRVPTAFKDRVKQLRQVYPARVPAKLWSEFYARINAPGATSDPDVIAAMRKLAPVVTRAVDQAKTFGVATMFDDDM